MASKDDLLGAIRAGRSSAPEAPPPPGPALSKWKSLWEGGRQGATFGLADEGAGGLAALLAKAGVGYDGVDPSFQPQSFGDAYREHRDADRKDSDEARAANPGTFLVGDLVGGIPISIAGGAALKGVAGAGKVAQVANKLGAGGIPLLSKVARLGEGAVAARGAALASAAEGSLAAEKARRALTLAKAGVAAAQGGLGGAAQGAVGGLGRSTAELTGPDTSYGQAALDTGTGTLVGAAIGAPLGGVASVAGGAIRKRLSELGADADNLRVLTAMGATGGTIARPKIAEMAKAMPGGVPELAKVMREHGMGGAFRSTQGVLESSQAARDSSQDLIQRIVGKNARILPSGQTEPAIEGLVDEAGGYVSSRGFADRMRGAAGAMGRNPELDDVAAAMRDRAETYQARFPELQGQVRPGPGPAPPSTSGVPFAPRAQALPPVGGAAAPRLGAPTPATLPPLASTFRTVGKFPPTQSLNPTTRAPTNAFPPTAPMSMRESQDIMNDVGAIPNWVRMSSGQPLPPKPAQDAAAAATKSLRREMVEGLDRAAASSPTLLGDLRGAANKADRVFPQGAENLSALDIYKQTRHVNQGARMVADAAEENVQRAAKNKSGVNMTDGARMEIASSVASMLGAAATAPYKVAVWLARHAIGSRGAAMSASKAEVARDITEALERDPSLVESFDAAAGKGSAMALRALVRGDSKRPER